MTTTQTAQDEVLVLITDPVIGAEVGRAAAAVDVAITHAPHGPEPTRWRRARRVLVDPAGAQECLDAALPRRPEVYLVVDQDGDAEAGGAHWRLAVRLGAAEVFALPGEADRLVRALADPAASSGGGSVLAVLGGRGGAGASVFAAALALSRPEPVLLVDLDVGGAGADLLLGIEDRPGLRWGRLRTAAGRVEAGSLRRALPQTDRVAVLTGDGPDPDPGTVQAVLAAGRDGGTVVCDLPRGQHGPAVQTVLAEADLTVVLTSADVRAAAATVRTAQRLRAAGTEAGLVVRGPAPGGLAARRIAEAAALPLWATMRPQPGLDRMLDRGGLRLGGRSPLRGAAESVYGRLTEGNGS